MTERIVKTQQELDAALADTAVTDIYIESPRGVWLELSSYGSATVRAYGSATVRAYGSATVRAYGSATVRASGSATVSASDSATVRASGSATVRASDSATVRASGSATVSASDSATVRAYDSATVRASGSATVSASDSATVSAYDSATVRAYDSATVSAGQYVAVHLHSQRVTVEGGVVIDTTQIDKHTSESWCRWQGVPVEDGTVIVYKAVNAELKSGYGMAYPIGETVTAPDWAPTDGCGSGLHFGPSPAHAESYFEGTWPPRYLACRVSVADAVGITGSPSDTAKIKAKSCVVLHEVDVHARPIVVEVSS